MNNVTKVSSLCAVTYLDLINLDFFFLFFNFNFNFFFFFFLNFFIFILSLLLDYKLYDLDCDLSSNENRFYVIRLFVQNKELNQKKKKKVDC